MSVEYTIQYTDEAVADLKALRAYDQRKVLRHIESHLVFEPLKDSKSRIKPMLQPFRSQYRLRSEYLRVYYDVSDDPRVVHVLRVLQKTTGATMENPT